MRYVPGLAPANLDSDGVRRFTEDELRNIARTIIEGDSAITDLVASVATNTAAIAAASAAWTAYTPTVVVAGGGTGTGSGRYKLNGKTLFLDLHLAITVGGTSLTATLPAGLVVGGSSSRYFLVGRENAVTGLTFVGNCVTGGSTVQPIRYDNVSAMTATWQMDLSGVIEVT